MKKYLEYSLLSVTSVKVAEITKFIPDPESFTKAVVVAFASAFVGAFAKWLFDKIMRSK